MRLADSLGALSERDFRRFFASSTVSALGDGVATVALAFAVLDVSGSATDLGIVLAARQLVDAVVVLAAGVWADRLPRQYVLAAAALVQGAAQAASAALLLTGTASIAALVGLQALYGAGQGFVIPASTGLVPQVTSAARLQQANALLGLSSNSMRILGPALGGLIVAVGSPGSALGIDAASFVVAAALLPRLRVRAPERPRVRESFFAELRQGWGEFRSRTWLWTTVTLFGVGNFVATSLFILGPVIAKDDYHGAATWAAWVSAFGLGAVAGGLVALRLRPSRPLVASILFVIPVQMQLVAVALRLPVPVVAAVAALAGAGIAVHLALWFTVFQRDVPEESISRVSAYDSLGSFVLIPLGSAVAGPVASLIGVDATLVGAAVIGTACLATMLAIPSVRAVRA